MAWLPRKTLPSSIACGRSMFVTQAEPDARHVAIHCIHGTDAHASRALQRPPTTAFIRIYVCRHGLPVFFFYFVRVSVRHADDGACTTTLMNTVRLLRRLHLWAGPLQTALPHLKIIAPHRHLGNRISAAASLRPDASAFLCPYAYPDAVPVRLFVNLQVDKPVKTLTANTIAGMPARRRRPSIGDFRSWNGFSP